MVGAGSDKPPARLLVKIPDGVSIQDAACVAVAYSTVEHMLFDNAHLEPGEWILVHRRLRHRRYRHPHREIDRLHGHHHGRVAERRRSDGPRRRPCHQLSRGPIRRGRPQADRKKGVDVVFEHTGADTWAGSLLSLKRGGRLVTCGATSGPLGSLNLMQLFQQQYRITGSFGAPMPALVARLTGSRPEYAGDRHGLRLADFRAGVDRLEKRDVFGKILIEL